MNNELDVLLAAQIKVFPCPATGRGRLFLRTLLGDSERRLTIPLASNGLNATVCISAGSQAFETSLPTNLSIGPSGCKA